MIATGAARFIGLQLLDSAQARPSADADVLRLGPRNVLSRPPIALLCAIRTEPIVAFTADLGFARR